MVTKTKLTIIFAFGTNLLFGQIFHAFHLNDSLDIKTGHVKEIYEELKFRKGGIKYLKKLNKRNQVISDERHDSEDNFIAKFTYTYDSLRNLKISETKEFVDESGSHYYNTEEYEYTEKGHLRKIIYRFNNGKIAQIVLVSTNDRGHPIKTEAFTESDILKGSETANYNYSDNKATFDQRDSQGMIIFSSFFTIDLKKEGQLKKPGFVYDDRGNLIKTPDEFNEITYDQYGNWTSIKRYSKVNGLDNLTQEQTRTIKYYE